MRYGKQAVCAAVTATLLLGALGPGTAFAADIGLTDGFASASQLGDANADTSQDIGTAIDQAEAERQEDSNGQTNTDDQANAGDQTGDDEAGSSPDAGTTDDTASSTDSDTDNSAEGSADGDAGTATDTTTDSEDLDSQDSPEQSDTENDAQVPASSTRSAAQDELAALLENTEESDLQPLASGYREDDSGTAPYDSVHANEDDLKALAQARQAAQDVVDDAEATDDQVREASDALTKAFDGVRFIYHYTGFTGTNGMRMYDNNGNLIQAHGAGFVKAKVETLAEEDRYLDENGDGYVYIWCGEDKTDRLVAHGVRIYYSDDLYNWIDKGRGFETFLGKEDLENKMDGADPVYQKYYNVENMMADPDYTTIYGKDFKAFANDSSNNNIDSAEKALDVLLWDLKALKGDGEDPTNSSCVFERPKMAYNESTGRWVIWFHADGPRYGNSETDATYSKAKAGVAISEGSNPAGPYKYLGSFRLNTGKNTNNPGMFRDMNLYVDDKDANNDGVNDAYLIYASNENADMTISMLDSTYTKLVKPIAEEKQGTDVADGATYNTVSFDSRESPAPVKWNGRYYIVYSHTTGWAPNQNEYMVSEGDNILGPYTKGGCPFVQGNGVEQNPSNSFWTQSSSIIPVDESKGLYVYFGDRWFNPDTGADISQSRYVMTPVQFVGDTMRIQPHGDWNLNDLNQYEAVQVEDDSMPAATGSISDLIASLPSEITVRSGGNNGNKGELITTPVVWDQYQGADQLIGTVTVTGRLPELGGVSVNHTVTVHPKDMALFIDAGSDAKNESDYFTTLAEFAENMINREGPSDRSYDAETGWGYTGSVGASGDMQRYETESNDIYETGWYANSNKNITYQADLKAGTYTVTAGFRDWWAQYNNRWVDFTVKDESGNKLATQEVGSIEEGMDSKPMTFTVDSDQTVQFVVSGKAGQDGSGSWVHLDPVLSWIGVIALSDDTVTSVEPVNGVRSYFKGDDTDENAGSGSLPSEVTVTLANGETEERAVTWNLSAANSSVPFSLTDITGTVDGTTLPATMRVQMVPDGIYEYFIDVNTTDENSGTWQRLRELLANRPADENNRELFNNAAPDQQADEHWGNATDIKYAGHDGDQDNPYSTGIYANESEESRKVLTYTMTLPGGSHEITFGFQDWWSQTRGTQISYSYDGVDETPLVYHTVTGSASTASGTIELPEGQNTKVTFTLRANTGTGPILSWIASCLLKDDTPQEPEAVSVDLVEVEVEAGKKPELPEQVTVRLSDGTSQQMPVTWNWPDDEVWATTQPGDEVTITGDVDGLDELKATAKVTVTESSSELTPPETVDPTPINRVPELVGVGPAELTVGDAFDPMAGVSATDAEDGDLTDAITVEGTVDTSAEGVYTLTYRVSDSQGATATAIRTVTVKAADAGQTPDGDGSGDVQTGDDAAKPERPSHIAQTGVATAWAALAVVLIGVVGLGLTVLRSRKR